MARNVLILATCALLVRYSAGDGKACARPPGLENGSFEPVKEKYAVRERVRYTCREGFSPALTDDLIAMEFECQFVERWSALVNGRLKPPYPPKETFRFLPTCKETVFCPELFLPDGITVEPKKPVYQAGDEIEFRCLGEDERLQVVGERTATCNGDGTWSDEPPKRCEQETMCEIPSPNVNFITIGPANRRYIRVGEEVRYTCQEGYEIVLDGEAIEGEGYGREDDDHRTHTRTCLEDGFLDGQEPSCRLFTCDFGETAIKDGHAYARNDGNRVNVGEIVHYRCKKDHVLVGDNVQYCMLYSGWEGLKPFCARKYCVTPRLYHGTVTPFNYTFSPDQTANFECDQGYTLIGPRNLTCTDNVAWSSEANPVCHAVYDDDRCMNLGAPLSGYVRYKYTPNRIIARYRCTNGFELIGKKELRCFKRDGEWDGDLPICRNRFSFTPPRVEALRLLKGINELQVTRGNDSRVQHKPTVLYVIVDNSLSRENETIEATTYFLIPVLREVMKTPNTRIGVIKFASNATLLLEPTDYIDNVTDVLLQITNIKAGTNVASSLKLVQDVHQHSEGTANIVLLVTDGIFNQGGDPRQKAEELKNSGFNIMLLRTWVTSYSPRFAKLASDPSSHIFHLNRSPFAMDFDEDFQEDFSSQLQPDYSSCGAEPSPTFPQPWSVSLVWNDRVNKISGVIIGTRWILALRPENFPSEPHLVSVQFGEDFERVMAVESIKVISESRITERLVLLKTKLPLEFSMAARPICIPLQLNDKSHDNFAAYARRRLYEVGRNGTVFSTGDIATREKFVKISACESEVPSMFCVEEIVTKADDYDDDYYDDDYYEEEKKEEEEEEEEEGFEHGAILTSKVHNKKDLRNKRHVVSGFFSSRNGRFVRSEPFMMRIFEEIAQDFGMR